MKYRFVPAFAFMSLLLTGCAPSIIGLAAGAGATVGVAAEREGGVHTAASDLRIKALISDKWFKYNLDTFAKLHLTVDEGRVLVTGIVQNPDARVEAVRLAWQVEGVTQVINEIRIADSESFPDHVRDSWITTRLRTEITFDRDVLALNYSIDTVDGTVYLMGVAANQAELDHVIDTARQIPDVKQVISYVKRMGEPIPAVASPQATKLIPDGAHAGAPVPPPSPQGQASYAQPDNAPQNAPPMAAPDGSQSGGPPPPPPPATAPPATGGGAMDMSGGAGGPVSLQPAPVQQDNLQTQPAQSSPAH